MDTSWWFSVLLGCTLIDGALLAIAATLAILAPDFLYRLQTRWFPMPRETFTVVFYSFLGLFKVLFIVFNLVPLIVISIVG